ncbi:MAG: radical SAM protein [Myxococcota bacterium]|nr:radical SAM protein [Myxococcota bacterium]
MKITLILAASPNDALRGIEPFMPLSLPLLAGAAPDHKYTLIDMLRVPKINYNAPCDLVGISVRMTAEAQAYKIADAFRARGVKVVLGGPQPSSVPLRAARHADAVVVGEAEELWPPLLQDVDRGELKQFYVCGPLSFEPGSATIHHEPRRPGLSGIMNPARHLYRRRYRFDTVQASRGCPIDCDFCAVPLLFGKPLRQRPVGEVAAEIEKLGKLYYLLDDTVLGRKGSYDYYLDLYERLAAQPQKRQWTGQVNLDALGDDEGRRVAKAAARSGLIYAAVGLESLSPAVLSRSGVSRKSGLSSDAPAVEMKERLRFLQELGVIVSGWFVVGYEGDGPETVDSILEFCLDVGIMPVVSPVNALPGTRLWQMLKAEGTLNLEGTLTNVPHPTIEPLALLASLDRVVEKGYSLHRKWRRTLRATRAFAKHEWNSTEGLIRLFLFAMILQKNMRKVLRRENANLASNSPQNYVE